MLFGMRKQTKQGYPAFVFLRIQNSFYQQDALSHVSWPWFLVTKKEYNKIDFI
tara:strand:- start:216 stop:374 length:159 start_codon:yes stop_codon:yes gene_type:complete